MKGKRRIVRQASRFAMTKDAKCPFNTLRGFSECLDGNFRQDPTTLVGDHQQHDFTVVAQRANKPVLATEQGFQWRGQQGGKLRVVRGVMRNCVGWVSKRCNTVLSLMNSCKEAVSADSPAI